MDNLQGNISTVLVALYAILAPYISQYMSQEVFLSVCGLILCRLNQQLMELKPLTVIEEEMCQ